MRQLVSLVVILFLFSACRDAALQTPNPVLAFAIIDLRNFSSTELSREESPYKKDLNELLAEQSNPLDSAIFYALAYKPDRALELLAKVDTTKYNDSLKVLYHLVRGRSYGLKFDLEKSNESADAMLAINPRDIDALNIKATVYSYDGNHEQSHVLLDSILSIDSTHVRANYNRILGLNHMSRSDEALAHAERWLRSRPPSFFAYSAMGWTLHSIGRHEEAVAFYDSSLSLQPESYYTFNDRGLALCSLGRNDEALEMFDKALSLRPDYGMAHGNKMLLMLKQGRLKEALASIEVTQKALPGDFYSYYYASRVHARQRNKPLMLENLKTAVEGRDIIRGEAQTEPDFTYYKNDPDFRKLVGLE